MGSDSNVQQRILVSWVGTSDLKASRGKLDRGDGPIASALEARKFDLIVLLTDTEPKQADTFLSWIKGKTDAKVELRRVKILGPTDFREIYAASIEAVAGLKKKHGADVRLTYHLSPGTYVMAAVWIILAKTRHAAELINSSPEAGVQTAEVPFDIAAEYIPDIFSRPDADLGRLAAALTEESPAFDDIISRSQEMREAKALATSVAPRSVPVLIEGESGTGKELFARAIHKASNRSGEFVAVNCGAIAKDIIESEFFGHKKGAFSGAVTDRKGHFENAHGGTLFLDEIGELPLEQQVKLLRVLETKSVTRVGSSEAIPVDVRIIAATNRNLAKEVVEDHFREDLFYRLAVAVIQLPPLRERSGDLTILIDHLLDKIRHETAAEPAGQDKKLSAGARKILLQHPWPGNVRELTNTLMRASIWSQGKTIKPEHVEAALLKMPESAAKGDGILGRDISQGFEIEEVINKVKRHYLERAWHDSRFNKKRAADMLGLGSAQVFTNWMEKQGLE